MAEEKTSMFPSLTRETKDNLAASMFGVSSALSVYNTFYTGFNKAQTYAFNANQYRQSANQVAQIAGFSDRQLKRANKAFVASQQIALTRGNIGLNGSAVDIMADTITQGELDRAARRFEYKAQETQLLAASKFARQQAKAEEKATYISGIANAGDRLFTYMKEFY